MAHETINRIILTQEMLKWCMKIKRIQMSMHLLPRKRIKKANIKYEIYDLKILEGSISGKFKLNLINKLQ